MKHLDLFSGIGGFALGFQWAGGFETVGFCEIEPYCQKLLKQNFPGIPIYEDIRKLDAARLGRIDIVTGGYPCQPFSNAGKRQGAEDDRHLWPEMLRIIKDCKPRWVIGENVAGHISMGLDQVLSDLENENYTTRTFIIPACAVDAPHRRDRVWIVAHAKGAGGKRLPSREKAEHAQPRGTSQDVSNAKSVRIQRQRARREPEPCVGRVAHGIPNRVDRIKGLGNAVVPQIPEILGRAIMEAAQ